MKHILSQYGVYTNHLASLSQDTTMKSADRAKIVGYYNKWTNAQYLLGCALFIDLLTPCAILSKVMQNDNLDIIEALSAVLMALKETGILCAMDIDQWPTYALALGKCESKDGKVFYQCQDLKNFSAAKSYYESHYKGHCAQICSIIWIRKCTLSLSIKHINKRMFLMRCVFYTCIQYSYYFALILFSQKSVSLL